MEEITAELAPAEVRTMIPLRVRPKVTVAAKTDIGRVREINEDKFEYYLAESDEIVANFGSIFIVCDGMGGHEAGQIASELACKTFIDCYYHSTAATVEVALRQSIEAANRFILDVARSVPSRKGMGTTFSGLILLQDKAYIVQVGDSRVYLRSEGVTSQVTTDHTWVEESVASGQMTREEAEKHPYRHMITRALGTHDAEPEIFVLEPKVGDTYFLCSDGVTNHVSNDRIGALLNGSPSEAAWLAVNEALQGGGSDNATVLIVRIDDLEQVDTSLAE